MKCQYCGKHSGTVAICSYKCEQKLCDLLEEEEHHARCMKQLTACLEEEE